MIRNIKVKIYPPDEKTGGVSKQHKLHIIKAPPGRHFTDKGILNEIEVIINEIETKFPTLEFKLVCIGKNAYNIIYIGLKDNNIPIETDENPTTVKAI
jgi:hypothetical protein